MVRPCYLTLAEQYEDRRAGAKPYMIKNYEDFNETFWQRSCLGLDIVGLTQDSIRKKFSKTFVERQSWLLPFVSSATRVLTKTLYSNIQTVLWWTILYATVYSKD